MEYFTEYIHNKNQSIYEKNNSSYTSPVYKPIKPTQSELARELGMYGNNGRLLKNNLSNYLRGSQPFPQDILLQIIYKLKLNESGLEENTCNRNGSTYMAKIRGEYYEVR